MYFLLGMFPKSVMAQIAEYVVNLHDMHSPRDEAIDRMNKLCNYPYAKIVFPPNRRAKLIQESLKGKKKKIDLVVASTEFDNLNFQHTTCEPIIGKLSRVSRQHYSPLQQYMRLHIAAMHSSDAVLEQMIKNKTLHDMPKHIWS